MTDMPRVHSRERATALARLDVQRAILDELDKHDLTDGEWLSVLHGAYDSTINGFIRDQIRMERHGNTDTPGGWE